MRQFLFAAAVVCVSPLAALAADGSWAGQQVFPRHNRVPVYDDKREKAVAEWGSTAGEVLKEDGEWLEVRHAQYPGPYRGWVRKREVVKAAEAPAFFTALLIWGKKTSWLYRIRAEAWILAGEHHKAISDLTAVIRLEPNREEGYLSRAGAYAMKGEHDKAIADFNEAIRLNPNCGQAYFNRGYLHYLEGDFTKAIKDLGEAVRLAPKNSPALTARGMAYLWDGDCESALKDFSESLKLVPEDGMALSYRGSIYAYRGEYEKAASDFSEGVRYAPQLREGLAWYAWLLASCPEEKYRDGKKAVELAKKAVTLAGKDPDWLSYGAVAAAYAECGDFQKAIEWEKKALEDLNYAKQSDGRGQLPLYERNEPYRMPRVRMEPPRK